MHITVFVLNHWLLFLIWAVMAFAVYWLGPSLAFVIAAFLDIGEEHLPSGVVGFLTRSTAAIISPFLLALGIVAMVIVLLVTLATMLVPDSVRKKWEEPANAAPV